VPGAQSWQVTAWYAPEVRRIVKIQSTSIDALNFEVISLEHSALRRRAAPPPAAVVPRHRRRGARGLQSVPTAARASAPAVPAEPLQSLSPREGPAAGEPATLALAAVASGGKGVSRVVVTLNGVVVARLEERAPQRAMPVNVALKLEEGQNVVVVTAIDADGITQQEMRAVVYDKVTRSRFSSAIPRAGSRDGRGKRGRRRGDVEPGRDRGECHPERHPGVQQRERSPKKSIAIAAPSSCGKAPIASWCARRLPTASSSRKCARLPTSGPRAPEGRRRRLGRARPVGRRHRRGTLCQPDIPSLRYSVADAEAFAQS
jgi:hypothetical protein